jgi:protein Tob/BTG
MRREIHTATKFIGETFLKKQLPEPEALAFQERLTAILSERYEGHWHPESPEKGCAYRCLRWAETSRPDESLIEAETLSNLSLKNILPRDLTLWIDPNEVSARIGETGSIFTVRLIDPIGC